MREDGEPARPAPRRLSRAEVAGCVLVACSLVMGLPGAGLLTWLSVRWGEPLLAVVGAPAAVVASHVLFGAGLSLAGGKRLGALVSGLWRARAARRRDGRAAGG